MVDQTKGGNDPSQEKKDEQAGKKAASREGRDHPAKQADPPNPP